MSADRGLAIARAVYASAYEDGWEGATGVIPDHDPDVSTVGLRAIIASVDRARAAETSGVSGLSDGRSTTIGPTAAVPVPDPPRPAQAAEPPKVEYMRCHHGTPIKRGMRCAGCEAEDRSKAAQAAEPPKDLPTFLHDNDAFHRCEECVQHGRSLARREERARVERAVNILRALDRLYAGDEIGPAWDAARAFLAEWDAERKEKP